MEVPVLVPVFFIFLKAEMPPIRFFCLLFFKRAFHCPIVCCLLLLGYDYFRTRCHATFLRNKDLGPAEVETWIEKGNYIVKELEALYMLKKYRTLKRRYYPDDDFIAKIELDK